MVSDFGSPPDRSEGSTQNSPKRSVKKQLKALGEHPLLSSAAAAVISGVILALVTPMFDVAPSGADPPSSTAPATSEQVGGDAPVDDPPITDLTELIDSAAEVYLSPAPVHAGERITSDGGRLAATVPAVYSDTWGGPWIGDTGDALAGSDTLVASPDISGFQNGWATPGVWIGVSEELYRVNVRPTDDLSKFDEVYRTECELEAEGTLELGSLTAGVYRIWVNCGTENSLTIVVSARSKAMLFSFTGRAVDQSDAHAITKVFDSIQILAPIAEEAKPGMRQPGYINP